MENKTKKNLILVIVGIVFIAVVSILVYNYFTSPGYYLQREISRQHEKQEALTDLDYAETKIEYYRTKRNAIQYRDLEYLGKDQGEAIPQLNQFIDQNQSQGD